MPFTTDQDAAVKSNMKIGIFGGAFNPVHNGHMNLAEIYYRGLELDKLIFIPTAHPPHKSGEALASQQDRLNMLSLAIEDKPYEVSQIEFQRQGKSYTYDTLTELKKLYSNDTLYLIIGADQFLTFDRWYRYKDILNMAVLCTCAREDEEEKQRIKSFASNLGLGNDEYFLSTEPVLRVSSSQIRTGIMDSEDISSLLPKKVLEYILEKGLYCV